MRVIYADTLFVLNFCMDFCILRAAAAIGGRETELRRLCAASCLGGAYAVLCVPVSMCAMLPIRIAVGAVMTAVTFGLHDGRRLLRQFLLVLLTSFVFGGCVAALEQLSGTMLTVGGVLYAPVSIRTLLLSAVLAYGLSGMVFRRQAAEDRAEGETVTITCGRKTERLYLLHDSGNTLHDPLTGRPVILLTRRAAMKLLPEELQFVPLLLDGDNAAELTQKAKEQSELALGLIAFQSIGGSGLLPCFHPDHVMRGENCYDCMAAVSHAEIGGGEYDGLIGL